MTYLHFIIVLAVCCLLGITWVIKRNIKDRPKDTIVITMAILIFMITGATIIKTYRDYSTYISTKIQGVILSNITFAIFLDFSVLIIGGLFLYLANQIYLADKFENNKVKEAEKIAKKKLKEAEEYSKPFKSSKRKESPK